jgi:hypothetical protein
MQPWIATAVLRNVGVSALVLAPPTRASLFGWLDGGSASASRKSRASDSATKYMPPTRFALSLTAGRPTPRLIQRRTEKGEMGHLLIRGHPGLLGFLLSVFVGAANSAANFLRVAITRIGRSELRREARFRGSPEQVLRQQPLSLGAEVNRPRFFPPGVLVLRGCVPPDISRTINLARRQSCPSGKHVGGRFSWRTATRCEGARGSDAIGAVRQVLACWQRMHAVVWDGVCDSHVFQCVATTGDTSDMAASVSR